MCALQIHPGERREKMSKHTYGQHADCEGSEATMVEGEERREKKKEEEGKEHTKEEEETMEKKDATNEVNYKKAEGDRGEERTKEECGRAGTL